jgi:hypothetical protein
MSTIRKNVDLEAPAAKVRGVVRGAVAMHDTFTKAR